MKNWEPLLFDIRLADVLDRRWMGVDIRVGAGVGHGEHERLLVGELEVLVGELLAVDGLATSALSCIVSMSSGEAMNRWFTHVATGEVTTLEHEVRDDTVELGARVAEALLASAESAEVLDGLGDDVVEELEVDAAGALCRSCQLAACELIE